MASGGCLALAMPGRRRRADDQTVTCVAATDGEMDLVLPRLWSNQGTPVRDVAAGSLRTTKMPSCPSIEISRLQVFSRECGQVPTVRAWTNSGLTPNPAPPWPSRRPCRALRPSTSNTLYRATGAASLRRCAWPICLTWPCSLPPRSAMVRETFSIRSRARAESARRLTAISSVSSAASSRGQMSRERPAGIHPIHQLRSFSRQRRVSCVIRPDEVIRRLIRR